MKSIFVELSKELSTVCGRGEREAKRNKAVAH